MNYILYVRLKIRVKFGCRQFAAPQVQESWQAMYKTKICLFQAKLSEHISGQVERINFR